MLTTPFGEFIWTGYPVESRNIPPNLYSLWFDKPPTAADQTTYPVDRNKLVYGTNGTTWGWYIDVPTRARGYICQAKSLFANKLLPQSNPIDYGQNDPNSILRGPCFVQQPADAWFVPGIIVENFVTFGCFANGNPAPKYRWYKIGLISGQSIVVPKRTLVEPLLSSTGRISISGGNLVIHQPQASTDSEYYQCEAYNDFGSILSRTAKIVFGQLETFPKHPRKTRVALAYQSVTIPCDPPAHSPRDSLIYAFYMKKDSGLEPVVLSARPGVFVSQAQALIGFSEATTQDSGIYVCMITMHQLGSRLSDSPKSPDMPLTVLESNQRIQEPRIYDSFPAIWPSDPIRGQTVRIECFAGGSVQSGPLQYTWRRLDGKLIPMEVYKEFNRVLEFSQIQPEDQGVYECSVTDSMGSQAQPKSVSLQIKARPYFIKKASDTIVSIGETVVMVCEAAGIPEPIQTVQTDSAMFNCLAVNSLGSEASSGELRVLAFAPTFQKNPMVPVDGMVGQSAVMVCQPEAAPAPTISWFFQGTAITPLSSQMDSNTGEITCPGTYCSLPNGNLLVFALTKAQAGLYECRAENQFGSSSTSAYLDVIDPLVVLLRPHNMVVEVNSTVIVPCRVQAVPSLDVNYAWFYEDVEIKFDRLDLDARRYERTQFFRPFDRNYGFLHIVNIQMSDAGRYTCEIQTPLSKQREEGYVLVAGPPGPCAGHILPRRKAEEGVGKDEPMFPSDNQPIRLRHSRQEGVQVLVEFITCGVGAGHRGSVDTDDGGEFALLERQAETHQTIVDDLRQTGQSSCDVVPDGKGDARDVEIKFDRLDLDARRYERTQFFRPFDRNYGFLHIVNIQMSDAGRYTCEIQTPLSKQREEGYVLVAGPPGPCAGVEAATVPGTELVVVNWTKGADHLFPTLFYQIEAQVTDGPWIMVVSRLNESSSIQVDQVSNRRTTTITNLYSNILYHLRVRAANVKGIGEPSAPSRGIITLPKPPTKVVQNVSGGGGKHGTLVVRWEPLPFYEHNGDGFHYVVRWRAKEDVEYTDTVVYNPTSVENDTKVQLTITLAEERFYKPYEVSVRAVNVMGPGPQSDPMIIMSAARVPTNAPRNPNAAMFNASAILVTWDPPLLSAEEGPVSGYRILYWRRGVECLSLASDIERFEQGQRLTLYGDVRSGVIIGLDPDIYYCIAVQSFNTAGDSPPSSFTEQTTYKLAPQSFPTMVVLNSTEYPRTVLLNWIGVLTTGNEESVLGYKIRYWLAGANFKETHKDIDVGMRTYGFIQNLEVNKRYNVRVFAYSRGGVGKMSSPLVQFQMIPKRFCVPGASWDGPDMRYNFVCAGSRTLISTAVLMDGGEGHVGSLRRFEARGEAVVLWDSGIVANYRCGALGFDLRVLDSSPTGEKHADSICEGCNESPIYGIRWKCMLCLNVDLCSSCYHGDKHCLNHRFLRITAPCKTRVAVGRRMKARKIDAVGLFPKARVVRGFDWRWGTQDCAEGVVNSLLLSGNTSRDPTSSSSSAMSVPCQGRIIDRRDWYQWAPRSAVSVAWDSGAYNVYRVGYMGMVDLKAVRPTKGGSYYVDHLPLLADLRDINAVESFQPAGVPRALENLTSTAASAAAAAPTWLNLETGRRASWHRRPTQIRESMPSTASESTDFETGVLAFASPSSSFDAVDSGDRMPLTEAVLNESATTESAGPMTSSQRPSSTPSQQPLQDYAQPSEASTHGRLRGGRTANESSDPARSRVQNSRTLLADLFCAGGGASGPGSVSDPSSPPRSRVAPETSGNRTLRTPMMLNRAPVVTGAATAVCRQTVAPAAQPSSNDGRPVAGASLVGATLRLRPGAVIQLRLRSMSNEATPSGSEYLSLPSVVERVDDTSGSVVLMVPQTGQRFTLTSSHQQCASAATGPCLPPASSAQLTVPVQTHSTGRHGEDQTRQQLSARQAASSVLTRMRRRDSYSRGNMSGSQPPPQPPQTIPAATAGSSSEAAGHSAREPSVPEGQSSLPARPDHETYVATGDRDSMPSASTSRGSCLRQSGKHVSEELMFAAAEGNVKKITWLIKHSEVDVNTHYAGGTALHIACQSGHLNCVDVLLRHGADCKQRDADGNQALHSAAQGGCLNVLRRIAMHCLEQVPCTSNMAPNYPSGQRPPSGQTTENVTVSDPAANASGAAATGAGDPSASDPGPLVQSASEQPLDVNSRNALRQTPLHLAAVGRHLDCARCLLEEFNALPSLQDCDGDTPLHDAISGQNMAMVELLLSDRADLTITNSLGHNCLHHGALVGDAGGSFLMTGLLVLPWRSIYTPRKDLLWAPPSTCLPARSSISDEHFGPVILSSVSSKLTQTITQVLAAAWLYNCRLFPYAPALFSGRAFDTSGKLGHPTT
ncbi:Contactin-3 [Sparganum proliferum]